MRVIVASLLTVICILSLANTTALAAERKVALVIGNAKRSGRDGSFDLAQAKSMDQGIVREFAAYGVNECGP
jgi:hypothetical protein